MKNWKQSHCVLSASGYLYIFSRKEVLYKHTHLNLRVNLISSEKLAKIFDSIGKYFGASVER